MASGPEEERGFPAGVFPEGGSFAEPAPLSAEAQFALDLFRAVPRLRVTPAIVLANVAVFVAMVVSGIDFFKPDALAMIPWGADFWPLTTGGQWWRVLTHAFLHFGIIHLAFNMWALSDAGRLVERFYGRLFFALIYLFGAVVGGLASAWWNPRAIAAGASGAVFAAFGALVAYLLAQPRVFPSHLLRSLAGSTLFFIGINVVYGLSTPGISNAAHLGGLGAGFALGLVLARPLDLEARRRQLVPRLVLGTALAGAALIVILAFIPICTWDGHAEMQFRMAQGELIDEQSSLINAVKAILQGDGRRPQSAEVRDQLVEQRIVPRWDALVERLEAIGVSPSSPSRAAYDLLLRYFRSRRDAVRALLEFNELAARDDLDQADLLRQMDKQIEHQRLMHEGDQLIPQVEQAMKDAAGQ